MTRNFRLLVIMAIAIAASSLLPTAAPPAIAQTTVEFDDFNATVEPESAVRQVGQTHTITITVTSDTFRVSNVGPQQTSQLIASRRASGVRVNFFITGANPRSGRTDPTDSSGKTTLSYRGTNPGRDFIQLTILSGDPANPDLDFFTEDVTVDWQIQFVTIGGRQQQQGSAAQFARDQKLRALTTASLNFAEAGLSAAGPLLPGSGAVLGLALCFASDQVETGGDPKAAFRCYGEALAEKALENVPGVNLFFAGLNGFRGAQNLRIAADPPDPNFKEIAQPTPLPVTRAVPRSGFDRMADALNALGENAARQAGLYRALVTSVERAQGAAAAGDFGFVERQNQAARGYAEQLARLVREELQLRSRVLNALRDADVESVTLTADNVRTVQTRVAANGLPSPVTEALAQAGVDSALRTQARQLFTSFDPNDVPSVSATLQQQAQALGQFAQNVPSVPRLGTEDDDDDDDKERPLTEEQKQQRERTNTGGLDDTRTEGNVVGVRCDLNAAVPSAIAGPVSFNPEAVPYALIATRDGMQQVRLLYDTKTQCGSIQVGDYLEADGEKQHEFLFEAHNVTITRGGRRIR